MTHRWLRLQLLLPAVFVIGCYSKSIEVTATYQVDESPSTEGQQAAVTFYFSGFEGEGRVVFSDEIVDYFGLGTSGQTILVYEGDSFLGCMSNPELKRVGDLVDFEISHTWGIGGDGGTPFGWCG